MEKRIGVSTATDVVTSDFIDTQIIEDTINSLKYPFELFVVVSTISMFPQKIYRVGECVYLTIRLQKEELTHKTFWDIAELVKDKVEEIIKQKTLHAIEDVPEEVIEYYNQKAGFN